MTQKAMVFTGATAAVILGFAQQASAEDPPWTGSEVSLGHYVSLLSFDKSAEASYNPYVGQVLNIDPRWKLSPQWALSAHAEVSTELTNSDVTTTEREPLLGDVQLTAAYKLPPLPYALATSVSANVQLPTSKESWARERIAIFGTAASLRRKFQLSGSFSFTPALILKGSATAATARSLTYDAPSIATCQPTTGNCEEFNHSGTRSAMAGFLEGLELTVGMPYSLSGSLSVMWAQSLLYPLDDATDPVTGELIPMSETNTDWRYTMVYALGVDWQAHKRFKLGAGFLTVNPQQAPDSTYYAPFFNRYTQAFVATTFVF